ncbi:MAG: hypothetical protein HQK83_10400 [Fibrobacteria bacterium]|nr:hypothetical protein [Fibrobacteria bacterium]
MKSFLSIISITLLLFGPIHSKSTSTKKKKDEATKSDVLTEFVIAIESNDYKQIEKMIAPRELQLLKGTMPSFPQAVVRRLKALKAEHLEKDPLINLKKGKIIGLYKKFQLQSLADIKTEKIPALAVKQKGKAVDEDEEEDEEEKNMQQLKRKDVQIVFQQFITALDSEQIIQAVAFIDPDELQVFFHYQGEITLEMTERLSHLDREGSHLLELRDGKLENIHLLVPVEKTALSDALEKFVKLLQSNKWSEALNMLTTFERKFLADKEGNIKPEYIDKLKALKQEESSCFMLFHDKLSGVLEWMGLGVYGDNK